MGKIDNASAAWQEILNETKHGANTHVRVGNAGLAIIEAILEVIATEAAARQNADTNEANARTQAIATAFANLTAAINNEATARGAGDSALMGAITDLEEAIVAELGKKMSASATKLVNSGGDWKQLIATHLATHKEGAFVIEDWDDGGGRPAGLPHPSTSTDTNGYIRYNAVSFGNSEGGQTIILVRQSTRELYLYDITTNTVVKYVDTTTLQNALTNEASERNEAITTAILTKMAALFGNTNLLFFGDCSQGFPAVNTPGELVFDTSDSTLNASFLFNGQWQWIQTELRQDTVYVYERSYYLWNSTAQSFTQLSDGGADEAALESKVDKVPGKGLSTNDLTDDLVAEIAKIGSKADFVGFNTIGAHLGYADTSDIFGKAIVMGVPMQGALIQYAYSSYSSYQIIRDFTAAKFISSSFIYSNFSYSNFREVIIQDSDFSSGNMSSVDFSYARIVNSNFRFAGLGSVSWYGAYIENVDFTGAFFDFPTPAGLIERGACSSPGATITWTDGVVYTYDGVNWYVVGGSSYGVGDTINSHILSAVLAQSGSLTVIFDDSVDTSTLADVRVATQNGSPGSVPVASYGISDIEVPLPPEWLAYISLETTVQLYITYLPLTSGQILTQEIDPAIAISVMNNYGVV